MVTGNFILCLTSFIPAGFTLLEARLASHFLKRAPNAFFSAPFPSPTRNHIVCPPPPPLSASLLKDRGNDTGLTEVG